MITVNLELNKIKQYDLVSNTFVTKTYKAAGKVPAPELKRGYRKVEFCWAGLREFFRIPANAQDVRLVVTKTPHPDAYELGITESQGLWPRNVYTLDGEFEAPSMYANALRMWRKLSQEGYKYARIDYRTPE